VDKYAIIEFLNGETSIIFASLLNKITNITGENNESGVKKWKYLH
jgi:hypothetical protein